MFVADYGRHRQAKPLRELRLRVPQRLPELPDCGDERIELCFSCHVIHTDMIVPYNRLDHFKGNIWTRTMQQQKTVWLATARWTLSWRNSKRSSAAASATAISRSPSRAAMARPATRP